MLFIHQQELVYSDVEVATVQILATVRFAQDFWLLLMVRLPSVRVLVVRDGRQIRQTEVRRRGKDPGAAFAEHVSGKGLCNAAVAHSDDTNVRVRNACVLLSSKWTECIVPLQLTWAVKTLPILVGPTASSARHRDGVFYGLTLFRAVEVGSSIVAYTADAIARSKDVRHACMSGFTRRAFEQALGTLVLRPNKKTQLYFDFIDTVVRVGCCVARIISSVLPPSACVLTRKLFWALSPTKYSPTAFTPSSPKTAPRKSRHTPPSAA